MNDESQARELAKLQRFARQRENERKIVVQSVMQHRAGREWLYNFLAECGCFHTPFATEATLTAFNCGQQNVGLRLLATLVEASPDNYLLMLKEQAYDRHQSANADAADSSDPDAESDPDPSADAT